MAGMSLGLEIVLAALGVALIALAAVDVFVTVLTTRGGGPVSSRVTSAIWRAVLALRAWPNFHRILSYAGAFTAILTVASWILLFWAGWLLIFAAGPESVVRATTGEAAGLWARVYYSGYTLFTLGLGDYRPEGAPWQVLTALAVGNGFMVISLSGSYLIPLVSAATTKRSIALQIRMLGASPSDILTSSWDGQGFSGLSQHLIALFPMIVQAGQQHLAYPVLHYFQSADADVALPVQIARLREALDLLEHGVAPQSRLPGTTTRPLRGAVELFGKIVQQPRAERDRDSGSEPDLELLRRAGIPIADEAEYRHALAQRRDERQTMLALVEYSGWSWEDVAGKNESRA